MSNYEVTIKPTHRDTRVSVSKQRFWSGTRMKNKHHKLNLVFTLFHMEPKNVFGEELTCHAMIVLQAEKVGGEWYMYFTAPINKGTQYEGEEQYELKGPIPGGAPEVRRLMREFSKREWTWNIATRELIAPEVD